MKLDWATSLYFLVIHVGAIAALFYFSWAYFTAFLILSVIFGLSITLGYHRLLTHNSFETYPRIRQLLAIIGALAGQGAPCMWVSAHRKHHKFSDREHDPHSPVVDSLPWAHMGWMLREFDIGPLNNWCPDLMKDKFISGIDRHYPTIIIGSGVLTLLVGGLPLFLWCWCLRIAFTNNATWLVNSAAHTWGHQPFTQKDGSRNLWWVALLSLGEGWHNAHHAFPTDARHGKRAWEFDPTYLTICLMEKCGLAWNVRH